MTGGAGEADTPPKLTAPTWEPGTKSVPPRVTSVPGWPLPGLTVRDGFLTGTGVSVGRLGRITMVGVGLGKGVAVGSGSGSDSGSGVGSSVGVRVGWAITPRVPNRSPGTITMGVDTGPEGSAACSTGGNGGSVGAGWTGGAAIITGAAAGGGTGVGSSPPQAARASKTTQLIVK